MKLFSHISHRINFFASLGWLLSFIKCKQNFQSADGPSNKVHDHSIVLYEYFEKCFNSVGLSVGAVHRPQICDLHLSVGEIVTLQMMFRKQKCGHISPDSFGKNRSVDQQWIFILIV